MKKRKLSEVEALDYFYKMLMIVIILALSLLDLRQGLTFFDKTCCLFSGNIMEPRLINV